ncbi:MAG: ion channel [Bacteroidia bacterium]
MKLKEIILENLSVIFCGVLIFFLDDREFNDAYNKVLIFLFCLLKTGYFLGAGFKKIVRYSKLDLTYYEFLTFIGLNVVFIIFSFAIDFLCLYQVDPSSFSGIAKGAGFAEKLFDCFYYSLLIFSNIGMATILPETLAAKSFTMFESILSFVTIIFILSDFISLKESLSAIKERKKNN